MKLDQSFYKRPDVVQIAKDLIGKVIYTSFDGIITGGIITETEAYEGITDKASHAYNDRRTANTRRNEAQVVAVLFGMVRREALPDTLGVPGRRAETDLERLLVWMEASIASTIKRR